MGRKDFKSQRGQEPPRGHGPLNEISRAYRGSQSLRLQAQDLRESVQGPLQIYYGCFVRFLTVGVGM